MTRYYANAEGTRFATASDDPKRELRFSPKVTMEEVSQADYDQKRAAARQAVAEASAAFLAEARAPQVEAAKRLVELGLSTDQAAAMARVPVKELAEATK